MTKKSASDRAAQIRRIVQENPGIRAADICAKTGIDKGTVSRCIRGLQKAEELVQKPQGAGKPRGGGRSMGLHMTSSAWKRKLLRERWPRSST